MASRHGFLERLVSGAIERTLMPQAPLTPAHKIAQKKTRLFGRALIPWVAQ
jgi:hypothetical protein